MLKKERLKKIVEIIETYEIDTQEELTEKLNELGLQVSQATVSRDINELNLVILFIVMLLGTYTGYRLTELKRFAPIIKENANVERN